MFKNKKLIQIIILVLIAVILFGLSSFGVYKYFSSKDFYKSEQSRFVASVGIFEDGSLYIAKAEKNIKFKVKKDKADSYNLTDKSGNKVDSKIIKYKKDYYIQANKDYEEGKTYVLELTDNEFKDKGFDSNNRIEFKIKEEEKANYKFNKVVKEINNSNIKVLSDDSIEIKNNKYKENDIILVKDKDDNITNAYKVVSVDGNLLKVEKPEVKDIYDNLDMYQEGTFDLNNLIINKELEDNIKMQVKKSNLFMYLVNDVNAAGADLNVNFSIDDGYIKIDTSVTLEANSKPLFGIKALKEHDVIIHNIEKIKLDYTFDVEKLSNISFDIAQSEEKSLEIELKSYNESLKGIEDKDKDELNKAVHQVVDELKKVTKDKADNKLFLGTIMAPTPVPGVAVYADAYFQFQFGVEIDAQMKVSNKSVKHYGFIFSEDDKRPYRNVSSKDYKLEYNLIGKEEVKIGVGFDFGISIINKDLASISLGVEAGAYQNAFLISKIKSGIGKSEYSNDLTGKFEMGIYLNVSVRANINVFFDKFDCTYEIAEERWPWIKIGSSEMIDDIESTADYVEIEYDTKVMAPVINKVLYDFDTDGSRREPIAAGLLYFEDESGNRLNFDGIYIDVKKNEDMKIYAVYEDTSNKVEAVYKGYSTKYKAVINVVKQGSYTYGVNNDDSYFNGIYGDVIGSLSIDSGNDATNAYKRYIVNRNFVEDYKAYYKEMGYTGNIYNVGYTIYDIDGNGVPEMIINASMEQNSYAWVVDIIYTYVNNQVTVVDKIYCYNGIGYEPNERNIVYSETKPSYLVGGSGFYKLVGTNFVYNKTVAHDRNPSHDGYEEYGEYYIYYNSGNIVNISEEEERAIFSKVANFRYIDINSVR